MSFRDSIIRFAKQATSLWTRTLIPSLAVALGFSIYLVFQIRGLTKALEHVDHSDQAISQVLTLQKLLLDAETGIRGYLLTEDPVTLPPFFDAKKEFGPRAESAQAFVSDNKAQAQRLHELQALFSKWTSEASTIPDLKNRDRLRSYYGVGEGRLTMDACRKIVANFLEAEQSLRSERDHFIKRKIPRVTISAAALTLLVRVLGVWILHRLRKTKTTKSI